MSKGIEIPSCKCERCGYTWYLRYPQKPRVCPSCKSPYWQASSDFIKDLNIDSQKAQEIIKELSDRVNEAAEKPTIWASVLREGWQRMLETSELPIVSVDRVYSGGFSVHDWFLNGTKISLGLAERIVEHFVTEPVSLEVTKEDVVERAEKLLEWRGILELLDADTVKVLGLVWFADKLSSETTYPETEVLIQENVWQLLEKSLGKKRSELIRHVEQVIEKIDEAKKGATSWAEVIRFA
jgi:hypothetical protein